MLTKEGFAVNTTCQSVNGGFKQEGQSLETQLWGITCLETAFYLLEQSATADPLQDIFSQASKTTIYSTKMAIIATGSLIINFEN